MRKHYFSCLLLLLFPFLSIAQPSWDWAVRAGYHANGFNNTPYEHIVDMGIDPNGNIYYLALIKASGQSEMSGFNGPVNTYGADDILVASYNCEGEYRWHKVIGGHTADMPLGIGSLGLDSLGGVYISSMVYSPQSSQISALVHFGNDTILPANTRKSAFLVKYDTSGNYQWLRMCEPDNILFENTIFPRAMDVAPNGDAYIYAVAKPGMLSGTNINITSEGSYIFKFNANGGLVSHIKLQMETSFAPFSQFRSWLKRDHNNGRFYLSGVYDGEQTLSMGGHTITNSCVVGAFDAQGSYLWHKTNNKASIFGFSGRPQLDAQGNITLLGNLFAGGGSPDGFNGCLTSPDQFATLPFIVQLNPQGVNNWLVSAHSTYSIDLFRGISIVNDKVVVGGLMYPSRIAWTGSADTIDITAPALGLYFFDLVSGNYIDTSSHLLQLPSMAAGYYNSIEAICPDISGNIYLGGAFSHQLTLPNQAPMNSSGGPTDVFMAKYGFTCNCAPPTANFNNSGNLSYLFNYTGTTPYQSITWNFGDGSSSAQLQANHTYANSGQYVVCVTAANECGTNLKLAFLFQYVGINFMCSQRFLIANYKIILRHEDRVAWSAKILKKEWVDFFNISGQYDCSNVNRYVSVCISSNVGIL